MCSIPGMAWMSTTLAPIYNSLQIITTVFRRLESDCQKKGEKVLEINMQPKWLAKTPIVQGARKLKTSVISRFKHTQSSNLSLNSSSGPET